MTLLYLDTSAAVKLLVSETGSRGVLALLNRPDPPEAVSTDLLETELRRYAQRERLPQDDVSRLLDGVALFALQRADFRAAGLLAADGLRSLDALHLQGALRLDVDGVLTYDARLASAAAAAGLRVHTPAD